MLSSVQNGFNPRDTFDPVEELRRARAANAGQRLVDDHTKEEAVLGAALRAHGDDSANLDLDNVDVTFPSSPSTAILDAAGCPRVLLQMPHIAQIYTAQRLGSSPAKPCHFAS